LSAGTNSTSIYIAFAEKEEKEKAGQTPLK
jgi:hypothetical protein